MTVKGLVMQNGRAKKVVYFAGVFDVFHYGHLLAIQNAKKFGDVLVVGVLNDSAVERYKGIKPAIEYEYRAKLISLLQEVDYVVEQTDTDPTETLLSISSNPDFGMPDILVRGVDYVGYPPGAHYIESINGKIEYIEYTNGISSNMLKSKIVKRFNTMTHHQQVVSLLRSKFGWDEIRGIEIGTYSGDLTKTILNTIKNVSMLYTIDPWLHVDGVEFEASYPQEKLDLIKQNAYKSLDSFIKEVRCSIIENTSDEAAKMLDFIIGKGSVDFVWIDGHHEIEQVKRDIENYLPFINTVTGGVLGGHDYGLAYGIKDLVDEKFGDKVIVGADFTWWVYV